MEKGDLKQNGVHLLEHEWNTVKFLLEKGYNIELIPPLRIKGVRTADIAIHGVLWEIKSPTGSGKNVIRHTVQHASHQSNSIIIDLRRCKMPEEKAIKEIENHFTLSKRIIRIKIITKDRKILDYLK